MPETTLMFDTIGSTSQNIPESAAKVAGYTTGYGPVPWSDAEWNRFPKAGHVQIVQMAVKGYEFKGNMFDVESGALTIAQAVAAGKVRETERGWNTCIYVSESNVDSLVYACKQAGLSKVELSIANWSLNETEAAALIGTTRGGYEIVAVQWASPTSNPQTIAPGTNRTLRELNLDLSITKRGWFEYQPPAPPPAPVPTPVPVSILKGIVVYQREGSPNMYSVNVRSVDDGQTWHPGV